MKSIAKTIKVLALTGFIHFSFASELIETQSEAFGGIGITLSQQGENLVIRTVLENSPAQAAGLQAGDVILNVDDSEMSGLSMSESVGHMRGTAGEPMELLVERNGAEALEFSVNRVEMNITQGKFLTESQDKLSATDVKKELNQLNLSENSNVFLNGKPLTEDSRVGKSNHIYTVDYGSQAIMAGTHELQLEQGIITLEAALTYRLELVKANGQVEAFTVGNSNVIDLAQLDQKWTTSTLMLRLQTKDRSYIIKR